MTSSNGSDSALWGPLEDQGSGTMAYLNTNHTHSSNSSCNSSECNFSDDVLSTPCTNDYCISDVEYLDLIRAYIYPSTNEWIFISMHCIVFVVGLVGNFLVALAVFRNPTMQTVTNYFIVNLALADFLVILVCLPPTVLWDVTETWFFGSVLCKTVLYIQTVSITVSVLTLTFISIDRWYAICYPLRFKSTTGRAKVAIFIIWFISLVIESSSSIKKSLRSGCSTTSTTSVDGKVRSRRKAAKMLIAVVVMFGVCYFPVHLMNVLRYSLDIPQNDLTTTLSLFSHWLCYANSAMNPIIYNIMSGKFRKEFKKAFFCCLCCCCGFKSKKTPYGRRGLATRNYTGGMSMDGGGRSRYNNANASGKYTNSTIVSHAVTINLANLTTPDDDDDPR